MTNIFVTKELDDGTLQIGDGSKTPGNGFVDKENYSPDLIIPEKIGEKSVSVIGNMAFYLCSKISSVSFPSTLREIHNNAFDCVKFNSGFLDLSNYRINFIGTHSFSNCNLRNVRIGKYVEKITGAPFTTNFNLEKIVVDGENLYFSNDIQGALYDKKQTRLIEVPLSRKNFTIPDSVTFIDYKAFEYTEISVISIPSSVNRIGTHGFFRCNALKEVYVYCKLTEKMKNMFSSINHEVKVYFMRRNKVNTDLFLSCSEPKIYTCSEYEGNFSKYIPTKIESACNVPKVITRIACNKYRSSVNMFVV